MARRFIHVADVAEMQVKRKVAKVLARPKMNKNKVKEMSLLRSMW